MSKFLIQLLRLKRKQERKRTSMAKKNCFILLNKNGNMITTDHKLPVYWNKSVALKDKDLFNAHKMVSVDISSIKSLCKPSATSEYLKNNAKKINNQNRKKYYYEIYYDRGGNDTYMQMVKANSYKEAKRLLLDIHKGKDIKISHYERKSE